MTPKKHKRVALYLRVSTSEQTTRNQRRELHAVAERHGWHVAATFEDAGVSGAKGRDERPGFNRLMMAIAATMFVRARSAAWTKKPDNVIRPEGSADRQAAQGTPSW